MKKLIILSLMILIFSCSSEAQVNVQLVIKKPVPIKISKWMQDPTIVQLILTNTTMNSYQGVIVSITLKDQNGNKIASTKDYDPKMKRININPNQTIPLFGPNILNYDVVSYNEGIKNTIITTGNLPEGTYTLCIRLFDAYNNEIGTGGEKCEFISVFLPEPPLLISPANNSPLFNAFPQFIWSPVVGSDPTIQTEYRLKVVKLFQGQTPKAGMENNLPILDKTVKTTSYQYLPSDLNLNSYTDVYGFAWQVQALDALTKLPVTGKEGKSEIWGFFSEKGDPNTLKLTSPDDNAEMFPVNGAYKFNWDASKQKKSKTAFILKISEIKQGQTPKAALTANQPVFYKTDINPNVNSYSIAEDFNAFMNGKKYAWQMFTVSQQWGGIIDTSEIRSFTIKSEFVEKIDIIAPQNESLAELDTSKNVFNFKWNSSKVKKSITSYTLKIAPIDSGQSPSIALHNNTAVYNKTDISGQVSNQMIGLNQGILTNRKYVWQITAFSKSYNNKMVAMSEIWTFEVVAAPTILENLSKFNIGVYSVDIKKVTNKSSNNFSGTGEVTLWNGGPKLSFDFNGLTLTSFGPQINLQWKVIKGQIWTSISPTIIPLEYTDLNFPINSQGLLKASATLEAKGIKFTPQENKLTGNIKFKTPMLIGTANPSVIIETGDSWFNVHPVNKIDSGVARPNNPNFKVTLLSPYNYTYELSSFSELKVVKNKLMPKLKGSITLPANIKDRDGNKITVNFTDVPGFRFDLDVKKSTLVYYKVTDNTDIMCRFDIVNIDLYKGLFILKDGAVIFNQYKTGLTSIQLNQNDNIYFDTKGFFCNISRTEANPSFTNYRGFQFKIKSLNLKVDNGVFSNLNNLKGEIFIPFLNQYAKLTLSIAKTGITQGAIDAQFINNTWINIFTDNGGTGKINVKAVGMGYFPGDNTFKMNAYFKFENSPGKGVSTEQLAVSNISIDSSGGVSVYGSDNLGWTILTVAKPGTFNGFPITIDKFRLTGKYSYATGVGGTIVLSDDLSNPSGTPFSTSVEIPKSPPGGKDAAFESPGGEFSTEQIPLDFGNNSSGFGAKVKWFDNDPVYGKGFMATMKLGMKNPGGYEVDSKIMIGRTNNGNGFSYWFVESGVVLGTAISVGFWDLGIKGFSGRIYSHMKHNGSGISASDYVPDQYNKFGVYAKLPITSFSDDGVKYWGQMALEIMIGTGFTSTLYGELNVLSSGYGSSDAKIKGNATITVCTSPKLFDSEVNVTANFWNVLCGNGQFKMHITENEWYMNLGTKEKPISVNFMCSSSGYTNYTSINQNQATIGVGYSYDTGDQRWGEVFGCWGRAWGGIAIDGTLTYKPFQITATAKLWGSAKIGVFVDIEVWSGSLTLLSGAIEAGMEATLPDPFCVAGYVRGEGCIDPCPVISCDICASATLKIRYKNGSFALKSTCSD